MSGALDHSPSNILRRVLISLGHGTDPSEGGAWPIFISQIPNSPDKAIRLTDTTPVLQGDLQSGEVQLNYGVQILVRGVDSDNGWKKTNEIAVALDAVALQAIDLLGPTGTGTVSYIVYAVTRVSGPIEVGRELIRGNPSGRFLFTINVRAAITQSP